MKYLQENIIDSDQKNPKGFKKDEDQKITFFDIALFANDRMNAIRHDLLFLSYYLSKNELSEAIEVFSPPLFP